MFVLVLLVAFNFLGSFLLYRSGFYHHFVVALNNEETFSLLYLVQCLCLCACEIVYVYISGCSNTYCIKF